MDIPTHLCIILLVNKNIFKLVVFLMFNEMLYTNCLIIKKKHYKQSKLCETKLPQNWANVCLNSHYFKDARKNF